MAFNLFGEGHKSFLTSSALISSRLNGAIDVQIPQRSCGAQIPFAVRTCSGQMTDWAVFKFRSTIEYDIERVLNACVHLKSEFILKDERENEFD